MTQVKDSNQSATVACDMTLFIRLLEVAREELKTDEALHQLVERCSEAYAAKKAPLTMDDYKQLLERQTTASRVLSSVGNRLRLRKA